MRERFQEHLEASGLIPPGMRVLVGYSGGADSTALLHLLHACRVDLVAGHLNHGQRAEADEEEAKCEAFANELGVPFVSGRADVPLIAERFKIGFEEAGRQARYEFFRQAAAGLECPLIATAHTRDDHVETVLMHLTRGAGVAGLAGIPERNEAVIRPLLPFARTETREYCEALGFWFHDDPANEDLSFARTRVRLRVLPELRILNPEADAAIARLASMADEESRLIDGFAAAALEHAEIKLNGPLRFLTLDCEAAFQRELLALTPFALLRRAVRLVARVLGATLDHEQTTAVATGLVAGTIGSVTAEGGRVVLEWDLEKLHGRDLQPVEPFRYPLTVPGEVESPEFGWRLCAGPTDPAAYERPPRSLDVVVDAASVKGPPFFRSMADGDAMTPLGFAGTRKVAAILGEAGLTPAAKRRLPVVCDLVGPFWLPGLCLAERVKVSPQTSQALRLVLEPIRTEVR
ncbi:MAG TPA: tRNA lysidine(34) synthetase TilS [Fimbriimonadaceae bacterium]|nr:tRNA lysidine(34) synthetase TilS [Fimbriimonadaceae bacterium]